MASFPEPGTNNGSQNNGASDVPWFGLILPLYSPDLTALRKRAHISFGSAGFSGRIVCEKEPNRLGEAVLKEFSVTLVFASLNKIKWSFPTQHSTTSNGQSQPHPYKISWSVSTTQDQNGQFQPHPYKISWSVSTPQDQMVHPNPTPTRSVSSYRPHKIKWSIPTPPYPYQISWSVSTHQNQIGYPHSTHHKIKWFFPTQHFTT